MMNVEETEAVDNSDERQGLLPHWGILLHPSAQRGPRYGSLHNNDKLASPGGDGPAPSPSKTPQTGFVETRTLDCLPFDPVRPDRRTTHTVPDAILRALDSAGRVTQLYVSVFAVSLGALAFGYSASSMAVALPARGPSPPLALGPRDQPSPPVPSPPRPRPAPPSVQFISSAWHGRLGANTNVLKETLVSATTVSAAVGALGGGWLSDAVGRRTILLAADAVTVLSAVIMAAAPSPTALVLGRLIVGFSIGVYSIVIPVFLAEISPASIRASLICAYALQAAVGMITGYGIDLAFVDASSGWRWMMAALALPAVGQALLLSGIPESPRWLANKGRLTEAEAARRVVRSSSRQLLSESSDALTESAVAGEVSGAVWQEARARARARAPSCMWEGMRGGGRTLPATSEA